MCNKLLTIVLYHEIGNSLRSSWHAGVPYEQFVRYADYNLSSVTLRSRTCDISGNTSLFILHLFGIGFQQALYIRITSAFHFHPGHFFDQLINLVIASVNHRYQQ